MTRATPGTGQKGPTGPACLRPAPILFLLQACSCRRTRTLIRSPGHGPLAPSAPCAVHGPLPGPPSCSLPCSLPCLRPVLLRPAPASPAPGLPRARLPAPACLHPGPPATCACGALRAVLLGPRPPGVYISRPMSLCRSSSLPGFSLPEGTALFSNAFLCLSPSPLFGQHFIVERRRCSHVF